MKRIILLFAGLLAINVYAQDASQLRIYLTPGHGSWGPDDRPMATIPYPATLETGRPDTCGFYESNTNLWKTLAIGERLIANGFKKENVVHSRTQNGPYPYVAGAADAKKYNRNMRRSRGRKFRHVPFRPLQRRRRGCHSQLSAVPLPRARRRLDVGTGKQGNERNPLALSHVERH